MAWPYALDSWSMATLSFTIDSALLHFRWTQEALTSRPRFAVPTTREGNMAARRSCRLQARRGEGRGRRDWNANNLMLVKWRILAILVAILCAGKVHAWSIKSPQHHSMERLEIEPSPSSLLLPDIPTFIRSKEVQQQQQQQWQRLTDVTRRRALFAATATAISSAATTKVAAADSTIVNSNTEMRQLEERMRADNINLIQPPFSISTIPSSTTNANNNNLVVYPSFLLGTWNVTQTLVAVSTPLGLQYAGGPNGIVSIGEQSIRQAKSRLFQPVSLQLRYVPVATTAAPTADIAGGVVEDRLFNTRQRFNSFAGKNVVANVVYEEPRRGGGGTAAATTVAGKGGATLSSSSVHPIDPIAPITTTTTTVTYFKGPAAQKTFVTAHHDASSAVATFGTYCGQTADTPKTWTGFECQRSLFALTNANTAPPIPTDSELLFSFTADCRDLNHVTGRLRIVGYLNPSTDTLYFAARNRAVTIQDYTLDLLKVV